jgi:hypothetical protein
LYWHQQDEQRLHTTRDATTQKSEGESNMEGRKSKTLVVGWVLLLLVALLLAAGAVASLVTAYARGNDLIAGVSLNDLAAVNPGIPDAIRGRRATAAFYAFSCAVLLAWIALTAFRRREKWAWHAILTAFGLGCIFSLLRVPLLGTSPTVDSIGILSVLAIALLVSARDFY